MSKTDYTIGHARIPQFKKFMKDRHKIWIARNQGSPKPWTDDPIFLDYKFTNVFRELDRGTEELREMTKGKTDPALLVANIGWYRLFNRSEHATDIGWCESFEEFRSRMLKVADEGKKIFTSAHMTSAVGWMSKLDLYLEGTESFWFSSPDIADLANGSLSLEATFTRLRMENLVGSFIAYEMVSDYRWYEELLYHATDIMSWANVGPGCKRGLLRLGMEPSLKSIIKLRKMFTEPEVDWFVSTSGLPFELREIEHSLCEFDKYMRVLTGAGRPRQKYNGRGED